MKISADEFRYACNSLGLSRSDIAAALEYGWGQVDKWWRGAAPVPFTVGMIIALWLHPEFPVQLRPKPRVPFKFELPMKQEKYFNRTVPRS